MPEINCPLCSGPLEARQMAPCHDCGENPEELEHFRQGEHTYAVFEVFPGLELTLCDFCSDDFSAYNPEFFGLPRQTKLGWEKLKLVRPVDQPAIEMGKVCADCGSRLEFARFVVRARAMHNPQSSC